MSQEYKPPPAATSRVRVLLVAVWAVLTAAAGGFVLTLGSNCPSADEWEFVPILTGHAPIGPWLWDQHNEHRLPLPRLLYLDLFRIARDFRAGMFLQVAMLSALSLWLMRLAADFRGTPHWADLFFPVSLLHAGHWENFLMGYQLCFALFTVLVTMIGVIALKATRATAFHSGVATGVLAMLLALDGGFGLAAALPVTAWVGYLAAIVWRESKPRAVLLALLAVLPALYLAAYLDGYHRPSHHDPAPDDGGVSVALVTGQTLAMAPGIGYRGSWGIVFAAMFALGGATIALLLRSLKASEARPSATGLIAVVAGVCGVALAIGIGRAGLGPKMGLAARYSLLVWPLLGLAYLVWVRHGGRGGKWVPIVLSIAAALAFPANMTHGLVSGTHLNSVLAVVEAEARLGVPPEMIVEHFRGSYQDNQQARAVRAMPMLREAGIGAFGAGRSANTPDRGWFLGITAVVLLAVAGRWLWRLGRAVQVERARELFRLQHERFEEMLLKAAGSTGKPRGLAWVGCEIAGDAVLARDTATRGIVALVPVVIRFEPIPGSDMEDVPAAREPRQATAVFTFHRGHWHTDGRVVFNLDPRQAMVHFGRQLAVIEPHH